MDKSSAKKSQQLGMPFGTAQHRLRKAVFFSLLVKYGENVCMRCQEPILSADDLSLDHKKDWLDVDPALFWDVENVGISHARCNKVGRHPTKKIAPAGKAWCGSHRTFLPAERFSNNRSNWNGLQNRCRKCRSENR